MHIFTPFAVSRAINSKARACSYRYLRIARIAQVTFRTQNPATGDLSRIESRFSGHQSASNIPGAQPAKAWAKPKPLAELPTARHATLRARTNYSHARARLRSAPLRRYIPRLSPPHTRAEYIYPIRSKTRSRRQSPGLLLSIFTPRTHIASNFSHIESRRRGLFTHRINVSRPPEQ